MTHITTPAAWPEGVIARYLTVGGATVDLTLTADPDDEEASDWDKTHAACTGCGATKNERWDTHPYAQLVTLSQAERIATASTRKWAQAHASTCRAMPKPSA